MYHPAEGGAALEFIELYNNRAVFEDLTGYAFTNGIGYMFEPGTIIAPKSYLVIARDPASVEQAYGISGVAGPFTGRLSNDGERIELSGGAGQIVITLPYDDEGPWPVSPDGAGHSLILSKPGGDPAAVEQVYGISGVAGPFTGRLSNDGERIELSGGAGQIVISLRYDDEDPWPVSPDGTGHSLILSRPGDDPAEASSWSPSTFIGGTPGGPDEVQAASSEATLVTLVDLGHPGLYFKGTTEPSPDRTGQPTTDWTEPGFQDNPTRTPWTEGPSGYGYSSEADELRYIATELNDMPGRYMSIYARLPFMLTPELIAS
ncbi:MAG: lamin tail domain-containing protein, partial [Planctomycetota bacterium]